MKPVHMATLHSKVVSFQWSEIQVLQLCTDLANYLPPLGSIGVTQQRNNDTGLVGYQEWSIPLR